MDFRIGAPVIDRNGDTVGKVRHVIVDPDTREVAEFVLGESGLLGREVLVPVGAVSDAKEDHVSVALDKDQLDGLKDFVVTRFVAPPPEVDAQSGFLYPQPIPPVGAATGLESIAYTPIVETIPQAPEGDIDIEPGTEVWATDGKVGNVDEVLFDEETRRVRGFVVKEGLIFHHDVEVSMDDVASLDSDRITLRVAKDDLQPSQDS